jgi:hypothetical protein
MADDVEVDGVEIVGTLLRGFADLTAIVPDANIKAGALPSDVSLPALLVRSVSQPDRPLLDGTQKAPTFERVSVAVRAANYRDQRRVMRLVKECCAGQRGEIPGVTRWSVTPAGKGPDLRGPGDAFEQSRDFKCFFNA